MKEFFGFLKNKIYLFIALILLCNLISSYMMMGCNNFELCIYNGMKSPLIATVNLLAVFMISFYLIIFTKNTNVSIRQRPLNKYFFSNILVIIKSTLIYFGSNLLLLLLLSFIQSNDFASIVQGPYNIELKLYFICFFVRTLIIYILIAIIFYLVNYKYGSKKNTFLCFFLILLELFITNSASSSDVWKLLFISYINLVLFNDFLGEIICSLLQILLLLLISIMLYKSIIRESIINFKYNITVLINNFLDGEWKLFIPFFVFYLIIVYMNFKSYESDMYLSGFFSAIGYYFIDSDFLSKIWALYQVIIVIYIIWQHLAYELTNSIEFISLRESLKQFYLKKSIFIFLTIYLFRFLLFIITIFIFKLDFSYLMYTIADAVLLFLLIFIITIGFSINIIRCKEK